MGTLSFLTVVKAHLPFSHFTFSCQNRARNGGCYTSWNSHVGLHTQLTQRRGVLSPASGEGRCFFCYSEHTGLGTVRSTTGALFIFSNRKERWTVLHDVDKLKDHRAYSGCHLSPAGTQQKCGGPVPMARTKWETEPLLQAQTWLGRQ